MSARARICHVNVLNFLHMSPSLVRVISSLSLLAIVGLGCGSTSPDTNSSATTAVPGNRPAETAPTNSTLPINPSYADGANPGGRVTQIGSLCNHPYYPIKTGYEVIYKNYYLEPTNLTGGTTAVQRPYRSKITQADNDSATLKISFDGSSIVSTQEIECTSEGLMAKGYVDLSSLQRGRGSVVRTTESAGLLLPKDLHVGSVWTQSFSFSTQLPGNNLQTRGVDIKGKVQIRRKAAREVEVTVGAGRFTAIVVEGTVESTLEFPGQGSVPFTYSTIDYWVRGKGLVKTESWMEDSSFSATAEAETITVP